MFEDNKFKESYRKAYDALTPDKGRVTQLMTTACENRQTNVKMSFRPVIAMLTVLVLVTATSTSALAALGDTAYEKIAEIAPGLADYILPVQLMDTEKGITMQVEAMQVEGKEAKLIVSFADEEGSKEDFIAGKVDMHDSYHLKCYGAENNVGGCTFLAYDASSGKAYFNVCVSGEEEFAGDKVKFSVTQLLVESREFERALETDCLIRNPDLKECTLSGKGGSKEAWEILEGYAYKTEESFPRFATKVMDVAAIKEGGKEAVQVTGIGYENGILRVQMCRGELSDADRHGQIFICKENGERRYSDASVSWQEEIGGESISFEEQWFLIGEEEVEDLQMVGSFFETEIAVKGNWSVTVKLEK